MEAPDSLSQEYPLERPTADLRKGKRHHPPSEASEPVRKSRRLQEQQSHKQIPSISKGIKGEYQLPSPSPSRTPKTGSLHHPTTPPNIAIGDRKWKAERAINIQAQAQVSYEPYPKRLHTESNIRSVSPRHDRINHWVHKLSWPKRYFEPDAMAGPALKRNRSSSSISDAELDDRSATPSDQKSRERKSDPYRDSRYDTLLEAKGSFMKDSKAGILPADSKFCKTLLSSKKNWPSDTLFDDRFFAETMDKIQNENEARIVRDIGQLISPSAEHLATRGMQDLHLLKESTNAGWNQSIPFEGPRPQPDFSVGFGRNAFSDDQLKRLRFDLYAKTHFTATFKIYFPFFTSEVKCGEQALNIADRQNAHSMTVAIKGIIELYRIVGRAHELHRKVLGFSISHDHRTVRIYAHYPEIEGLNTKYYRHTLREFIITDNGGKERWTANQFVRNIYDQFVPGHLKRIKSAIDQLSDPTLESFQSTQATEDAESSQEMVAPSAPSSQKEVGSFKKPSLPKRGSVADLRAQLERKEQELGRKEQEKDQLMGLLKQQTPSNTSAEPAEIRRQNEGQQKQFEELMGLLKEKASSHPSITESALQEEVEGQRKQLEEQQRRYAEQQRRYEEQQKRNEELMVKQQMEEQRRYEEQQKRYEALIGVLKQLEEKLPDCERNGS